MRTIRRGSQAQRAMRVKSHSEFTRVTLFQACGPSIGYAHWPAANLSSITSKCSYVNQRVDNQRACMVCFTRIAQRPRPRHTVNEKVSLPMPLRFEWDPEKAARNTEKHQVSFIEAATVFSDTLSITFHDPDHSDHEDRYLTIGLSRTGQLLIVSHTDRGDRIRIISARKTTPREKRDYEEYNRS